MLLDQHWSYARLKYPICLLSRTGREMLTFVRSMMEWLGGTVSKEDVGQEVTDGKRGRGKRKRDDDVDDDAVGAFALRFKCVCPLPPARCVAAAATGPLIYADVDVGVARADTSSSS